MQHSAAKEFKKVSVKPQGTTMQGGRLLLQGTRTLGLSVCFTSRDKVARGRGVSQSRGSSLATALSQSSVR
jgi:hypothetical protein